VAANFAIYAQEYLLATEQCRLRHWTVLLCSTFMVSVDLKRQ